MSSTSGYCSPDAPHHVEHALRVAVRGVDDEHVDVRRDQRLGALERVFADADGGADAQPAEAVLARVRVLDHLLDVLDGDQALQHEAVVDDQQLLDLVAVQESRAPLERRADRHREQRVARHDVGDRPVEVGLEPQVAVRQDADQPPFLAAVLGDRHARDPVLLHQIERFVDPVGGGERDRVDDHPALGALHAIDLGGLLLDRQVLVDDADATLLRHRDRQPRLGHRVHRRAEQRHVQADVARDPGERPPALGSTCECRGTSSTSSNVRAVVRPMEIWSVFRTSFEFPLAPRQGQQSCCSACRSRHCARYGSAMALLVFLPAAARARIVAAHLRLVALDLRTTSSPPVRAGRGGSAAASRRRAADGAERRRRRRPAAVQRDRRRRRGGGRRTGGGRARARRRRPACSRHRYRTISSSTRSFMAWKSAKLSFLYSTSGSRWP